MYEDSFKTEEVCIFLGNQQILQSFSTKLNSTIRGTARAHIEMSYFSCAKAISELIKMNFNFKGCHHFMVK
jgi:hypothetical protein